jgi:hypothetical protein
MRLAGSIGGEPTSSRIFIGQRVGQEMTEILLTSGDYHRHSGDLRIHNRTQTLAQTAGRMQIDENGFTGCLRVPVRHGNRGRFQGLVSV